jgi:hypothetical protein
MTLDIDDRDLSLFRELYFVLAAFADEPTNTISRIGGGHISIPDDQANDFGHFRRAILEKYPAAANLELMRVVAEVDAIFSRKSRGGASFEEWFWTNKGFLQHPDWDKIRTLARAFLVR